MEGLKEKRFSLPVEVESFCFNLKNSLIKKDGFRKRAVPGLLAKYYLDMENSFKTIKSLLAEGKYYLLFVGVNHTTIGGKKTIIPTPTYLSQIAENIGWTVQEKIPLQTYRRYGINKSNAIEKETLLILKNE